MRTMQTGPTTDIPTLQTQEDAGLSTPIKLNGVQTPSLTRSPENILAEAQAAAVALKTLISQKGKKVIFNGEQYLEFEDWQTVGRFFNITAKEDGDPEWVDLGLAKGFKASAVAVLNGDTVLSRATAYCLDDEDKWRARSKYEWQFVTKDGQRMTEDPGKDRIVWVDHPTVPGKRIPKKDRVRVGDEPVPLFQLASMAQTRAGAKVLRNVLAWVVVLAGYKPTPAEELAIDDQESEGGETPSSGASQEPRPAAGAAKAGSDQTGTPQTARPSAPPSQPAAAPPSGTPAAGQATPPPMQGNGQASAPGNGGHPAKTRQAPKGMTEKQAAWIHRTAGGLNIPKGVVELTINGLTVGEASTLIEAMKAGDCSAFEVAAEMTDEERY